MQIVNDYQVIDIVQFIPFNTAKSIINEYSTFCLRNINYFRNLEEQNNDQVKGDKNENIAEFQGNGRHYELVATTLISCWTKISSNHLDASDWNIFNGSKGIALVSTVKCVRDFLARETENILDKRIWYLENGEVNYYDGLSHSSTFDTMKAWQCKRMSYKEQREYRFAFLSGSIRNIDTLIFYTLNPEDYIKKIYFGPEMTKSGKNELIARAWGTKLAGLIVE